MTSIKKIDKQIEKTEKKIEEIEDKIEDIKRKVDEKKITKAEKEKLKMKYQSEIIGLRGRIKRLKKIRLNIDKKERNYEEELEEIAKELDEKEERKEKIVGNILVIFGIVGMAFVLSWDLIKGREISYGIYAYSSILAMLIIWILGLIIIWFASKGKYLLARESEV